MKKQTLTMIILIALTGCGIEGQSHSSTPANAPNLFVSQCGDQLFPDEPSLSFAVKGMWQNYKGSFVKGRLLHLNV
ncbi:hypothetical protein [Vibrio harveyi]|uniref:hypothetical protein n=1 Tax=Vibrio harveyi TaxID=669 RepID=UPI001EED5E5C|nr:hypothetical protein [Vibrio harveyi]